ncbi:hypothetical protein QVD17_14601 [Tagetes erecta]|uniref:Uncharacterized protein n=1 Tax=Tagetes erecta TaxID=13708 RepID=A0AAD8L1T6_TARER|nr:hypothetical protein QVD17_14601 [Tagetes erecta]
MSSSSSQLYNRLLNDDDDTSSDEYEEELAVTSAMSFVVRGLFEETENTTNPIRKRVSLEHDRAKANENLMKDYFVESPRVIKKGYREDKIRDVMYACIILHNMILEDDGNAICQNYIPGQVEEEITQATFEERVANDAYLRNKHEHYALMADLIEHAWSVRTIPDNDDDAS